MYQPKRYAQTDVATIHDLIRARPLATLVTRDGEEPAADHIPMLIDAEPQPFGTLRGHVARANRLWKTHPHDHDVLALFHGPSAYISPSWYPTKREHGEEVPTWNYAVAHAYGRLRVIEDRDWLHAHLTELTDRFESGAAMPWALSDAPEEFVRTLIGAVVGIEIVITRLEGKWKMSQNHPERNRRGVVDGLRERGMGEDRFVAEIIEGVGDRGPGFGEEK